MPLSTSPWAVYEFNGNNVDAVGNGPTLSDYSTQYNASGLLGQCIEGFYTAAKYPSGLALSLGQPLSVSFWVKVVSGGTYASTQVCASNSTCGIEIGVSVLDTSAGSADISYVFNNATGTVGSLTGMTAGWHHIAATLSAAGGWKLYKNASLVGSGSGATSAGSGLSGQISAASTDGDVAPLLDQLSIFKAELTTDDITYIYNAGSGLAYASWEVAGGGGGSNDNTIFTQKHQLFTR